MSANAASTNSATNPISGAVALLQAMGLSAVQVSADVVALCTTLPKSPIKSAA